MEPAVMKKADNTNKDSGKKYVCIYGIGVSDSL